jgi:hypothetical protein
MKETDNALGCLISILAIALLLFLLYHGTELANLILGHHTC